MIIKKIFKRHKLIILVFVVVFIYFSYNYFRQEIKLQELSQEKYLKKVELQEKDAEVKELRQDLKEVKSNENISRLAREKLKMVYPGEVLYIIEDEQ
jgi:cell division protein FtsB